jgi:hypothetical protein
MKIRKRANNGAKPRKLIRMLLVDRSSEACCRSRLRSESGKSLPAALITLAVGSLLLTPFLSFISSRSLGGQAARETVSAQYAADSGVEFAIWSLLNTSPFRSQVDNNLGTPQNLAFPAPLNGYTPIITVTGLPIGNWFIRQSASWNIERGSALAYAGGNRIYAMRGNNSNTFGYYSISADQWFNLANTPNTVQRGGALVYGGGNFLYALRGRNSDSFWRYNITTNSWSSLEDTPARVSQGGDLVFTGGNHIFAFRGNSTTFWRYSISSDSWSSLANAPASVSYGSDLVHAGGNTLYAFRGSNQTDFWRYNIGSDSWSSMQNAPASVGNGGNLAYFSGSYIYALRGNSNVFWRYTMSTDSWSTLTSTPANVGRGADMVFTHATGGFATRGGNQSDFWEFEVTPPRFDISSQAGNVSTDARLEINGSTNTILFWDIE